VIADGKAAAAIGVAGAMTAVDDRRTPRLRSPAQLVELVTALPPDQEHR
jgi:hypothetical protein